MALALQVAISGAQNSLDFQGPSLSMALVMDVTKIIKSRIKIITSRIKIITSRAI